MLTEARR